MTIPIKSGSGTASISSGSGEVKMNATSFSMGSIYITETEVLHQHKEASK